VIFCPRTSAAEHFQAREVIDVPIYIWLLKQADGSTAQ
jgi:hypothetical protein